MFNILIGLVSGIISGMGIGGGAVLIPALVLLNGVSQQVAQGINLVYFIPTAIVSLIVHIRNKNIDIKTALITGSFGLLGAVAGAFITGYIGDNVLRRFFGIFLFGVGVYEVCQNFIKKSAEKG